MEITWNPVAYRERHWLSAVASPFWTGGACIFGTRGVRS
jgi:hypothetical protein